ncbi:MBL fold metallo-hydrolase [Deinococcus petrolearius]|uniref:MBL fold metallo-hydrolase n=1 Tax=Deinococcus petrolearius TaxID=1751295 RepID=A0ABW1DHP1_9DEIO
MTPPTALTFLGTADSKGVPRFWCGCPVCAEARGSGSNRRTRTALLLRAGERVALLDAGMDLHAQLARLGTPLVPDLAVFSHAHNDHILGLGDLLDYRGYDLGTLPMYAPPAVAEQIAGRFAYAFRAQAPVQPLPPEGLEVGDLRLRLFEVPHGANGRSHAFALSQPGRRAVVMTDAIDVPEEVAARWLENLDLLVLGTSFADESAAEHAGRSVYDVREALALPWARAARRVVLTHLSHDVDVRQVSLPPGWQFAREGESVSLD